MTEPNHADRTAPEATTALVLGIAALAGLGWIPLVGRPLGMLAFACLPPAGAMLGIAGIVLAYQALRAIRAEPEQLGGRRLAIAGLVTSGVGLLIDLVPVAAIGALAAQEGL